MKKLFILLTMLIVGIGSMWALDVTVIKSSVSETTYGSLTSGTFTTNITSGLSGVTVSGVTLLKNTSFAYGSSLGFENVTSGTITLSAPEGYTILGYSLTARSNTYSVSYTLTPAAGGSSVTTNTSGVALVASGVNSRTTTISYSASSSNHFYIPSLVIKVKPDTKASVNVVYKEVYEGAVKCTHNAVTQVEGEAPSIPSGLLKAYCTYKYYTTEACTGDELSELTTATTEVYAKVTFTPPFTLSSGFDGATWYYLYFNRTAGKRYWQMNPNNTPYPSQTSKPSVSEALWAFTGDPYDGIKVMNARAGNLYSLKKQGSSSGSAITMQKDGDSWVIGVGNNGFYLKEDGTNVYIHDYSSKLAVWNSGGAASDPGSAIQVEDASPVKVTYKLTYNGNVISSYTKDLYELVGATAAAPFDWELPAYCSLGSCTPATITAETTEVTIPLNWNGPFDFSTMNNILNPTDAELENASWYYMNIGNRWIYSNDSDDQIGVSTNLRGALDANTNALWAFVGNPIDGVRIINKAKNGSVMVLWTPCKMDATTGYTHAKIVNSSGDFKLIDDENYYVFYEPYYNKIWTAQNKLDESSTITVISSYCGQAINDVYTWADTQPVDVPFGINSSCLTTIENNFTNMYAKMTQSQYEEISIPSDIISAVVYVYPTTGYYRIKSSGLRSIGESYIGYGSSDYGTGLRTVAAANKMTDVSTVIRLTGSAGTYKISTEGLNVQSQTTPNKAFTATTAEGVDFVFTVSSPGVVTIRNAASESGSCQGNLHEGQDGSSVKGVINWQASSDQSKWTVEEAESLTISLNSDGATTPTYYATFCAPFSYTVSDGTKAYTLEQSGEWLVPTEIEGEVAAGTPVLLKGSSATATLTIGSGYAESPLTTTALTGTYLPKTIAGSTDYVLGKKDKVGFYHWSSNNLAANRAYLAGSSNARGFALMFDDDATGIVSTPGETEEGTTIYNLSGQRLNKMQKGINIVNGKKVLF